MSNQKLKLKLKVGSRQSKLALVQVDEFIALMRDNAIDVEFDCVAFSTQGDDNQTLSLTDSSVPENFFTNTLDQAVLNNEIDIAIHSAKDLPENLENGLCIYALTKSQDNTDALVARDTLKNLSANPKIGTSSIVRQQSIRELREDVEIVDIRGTIQERIAQVDSGTCDGVIVATIALKRLGLENRIAEILPWEGTPLQGKLAVVGRADRADLRKIFQAIDIRQNYGTITLVGAGPGDPDLITLKGVKALQACDCVFYDYLAHTDILKHCPQAEKIYVGKRKGEHSLVQKELSKQLRVKVMEGKNVVRLKGGDPLIFGRGADEIAYLKSFHINVKVIPGVSSATAIASSLGLPLTARGISSSVAFISAHSPQDAVKSDYPLHIPDTDTLVFFMGLTKLKQIVETLLAQNRDKLFPMIIISRGTCVDQKIVEGNLTNIVERAKQEDIEQPALIIAGWTVAFWKKHFYNNNSILYTGTNPQKYKDLGPIIHLPMILIQKKVFTEKEIDAFFDKINDNEYIILTSRFSVEYFFELLSENSYELDFLKNKKFITIGRDTNDELKRFGCDSFIMSKSETSQGLFEEIYRKMDVKDKTFLFPRSALPNPYLRDKLTEAKAYVDEFAIYENVKPKKRELPNENIASVIFTSPSTVHNFLEDYQIIPKQWNILSKGPVTASALQEAGYESEIVSINE